MAILTLGICLAVEGCSSLPHQNHSGHPIAASGPAILSARAEPSTIELNRNLQPIKPPEILAEVKDFKGKVTDVKLRFINIPIQVPMENIGGTTWRAELTPQQLQMLAVSGKTMSYDANVVAKNDQGQTGMTQSPVTVAIKSPDLSQSTAG